MKVKCIKMLKNFGSIKINDVCKVICITIKSDEVLYRIIDNSGSIGLYSSEGFHVLDNNLTGQYSYREASQNSIELAPSVINYAGFWENFYNDEIKEVNTILKLYPEVDDDLYYV